ncbi:Transcription elongation factor SPT5 like protein, partial [Aduncisulcus paluster]
MSFEDRLKGLFAKAGMETNIFDTAPKERRLKSGELINLEDLYKAVKKLGGADECFDNKRFASVRHAMKLAKEESTKQLKKCFKLFITPVATSLPWDVPAGPGKDVPAGPGKRRHADKSSSKKSAAPEKKKRRFVLDNFALTEAGVEGEDSQTDGSEEEGEDTDLSDPFVVKSGDEGSSFDDIDQGQMFQNLAQDRFTDADDMNAAALAVGERYVKRTEQEKRAKVMRTKAAQPGVGDPHLWEVSVKPGREMEVCFGIMEHFLMCTKIGVPPPIFNVIVPNHLKGRVFVEAHYAADVEESIRGLDNIYFSAKFRKIDKPDYVLKQNPITRRKKKSAMTPLSSSTAGSTVSASASASITAGSTVKITRGALKGRRGKVIVVKKRTAEIQLIGEDVGADDIVEEELTNVIHDLKKHSEVTVVGGKYRGCHGFVFAVGYPEVRVYIAEEKRTVTMDISNLREGNIGGIRRSVGIYKLGDIVRFGKGKNDKGVIFRIVNEDSIFVLHCDGQSDKYASVALSRPAPIKRFPTDMNGTPVNEKARIKITRGEYISQTGIVAAVTIDFIFVKLDAVGSATGSNGFVVLPPSNVRVLGAISGKRRERKVGMDSLIGKMVSIERGHYSGYHGFVKTADSKTVTLVVDALSKEITMDRGDVGEMKDDDEVLRQGGAFGAESRGWADGEGKMGTGDGRDGAGQENVFAANEAMFDDLNDFDDRDQGWDDDEADETGKKGISGEAGEWKEWENEGGDWKDDTLVGAKDDLEDAWGGSMDEDEAWDQETFRGEGEKGKKDEAEKAKKE